ncbi:MAG: histidine phosphatase family protein [Clostridia bacterium]|nr:MAG: histidine phosphatase family protein [Clostridia bacterium]
MTRLYLVRHASTGWNKHGQYQGHSNVALSDAGRQQARLLAKRLADKDLHFFYASDLSRAFETAQIVAAAYGQPVTPLMELREVNFGLWEGLTFQEINEKYAGIATQWRLNPGQVGIPQGERFAEVQERACRVITDLVARHPDKNLLVVSHGGTIRTILCGLLDLSLDRLWGLAQDNTAVNIIDFYDGRPILTLFNDAHHLEHAHGPEPDGEGL